MKVEKDNILLSIVVPAYNTERYLEECVDSIIKQSSSEMEIIIVDDGSSDDTPQICDKFIGKHGNLSVIHKENGGSVSARKAGVSVAKGQYITFVDSDDWIEVGYIQRLIEIVKKYSPDLIAVTGHYKVETDGRIIQYWENEKTGLYQRSQLEMDVFPEILYREPYYSFGVTPTLCLKIIKKTIVSDCMKDVPDCITMGDDLCVSYPAILKAQTIYFADICGYYYRMNSTSITHKYDSRASDRAVALLDYMDKQLGQYNVYNINAQMDVYATWIAYLTITSLVLGSKDIHHDLNSARTLLSNKHVASGLAKKIPLKTKIILKLAINNKTSILLLTRKCFTLKTSIKRILKRKP